MRTQAPDRSQRRSASHCSGRRSPYSCCAPTGRALEWLTEALWGNEPPDQPEAALRVCISRLRKCLGPCAVRLESVGQPGGRAPGRRQQHGYQMTVRPGELDLDEFGDLFSQGEAELETGNSGAATSALMQALALCGVIRPCPTCRTPR